jgi:hypothetical protein
VAIPLAGKTVSDNGLSVRSTATDVGITIDGVGISERLIISADAVLARGATRNIFEIQFEL